MAGELEAILAGLDLAGDLGLLPDGLNGKNNNPKPTGSSGKKGPIRGARLEYDVPAFKGRVLLKEPFGFWLGLTPVYPEYGVFKKSGKQGKIEPLNIGKLYTKRAGFRFASYTILLKPGTKMKVPVYKAAQQRVGFDGSDKTQEIKLGNFTIGVSKNVSVNEFIEFLKKNKQSKFIIGVITPKLRKYQWAGVLHGAKNTGGGTPDVDIDLGGIQLDIPGI